MALATGTETGVDDSVWRRANSAAADVHFEVIPPWKKPAEPTLSPAPALVRWTGYVTLAVMLTVVGAGVLLARRNWIRGRADRSGAIHLGAIVLVLRFFSVFLQAPHYPSTEILVVLDSLQTAIFNGVIAWILYLGLEPYLRRRWPRALVSWNRAISGRIADPMVARDLLIGSALGGLLATFSAATWILLKLPGAGGVATLAQLRLSASHMIGMLLFGILTAVVYGILLLLAHLIVRNRVLAVVLTTCVVMMFLQTPGVDQALEIPARFLGAAIMIGSLVRFGLLCSAVVLFVSNLIFFAPTTLDPSSFFFGRSLIAIFIVVLIAGYGFYRSLGSQPVFAEVILDD